MKGRRVNLTIWVRCLKSSSESPNVWQIYLWPGHRRRGALPRNYFLVLSWDTRNSFRLVINHKEIFSSVAPNSLYAAAAVYDITDRESYEAIPWWFAERIKYVPESTIKIIVGNKADKVRLWVFRRHRYVGSTSNLTIRSNTGACTSSIDRGSRSVRRADGVFVCRDVGKDRDGRIPSISRCRGTRCRNAGAVGRAGAAQVVTSFTSRVAESVII